MLDLRETWRRSQHALRLQIVAATPACCAARPFTSTRGSGNVGAIELDAEHISQVINAVKTQYNVAEDKVYIVGWENGGFEAYRMACESQICSRESSPSVVSDYAAMSNCAAFNADQDSRERSGHPR